MISKRFGCQVVFALAIVATVSIYAFAHVTVSPTESVSGRSEKYTMRVPNERAASTVSLEVQIPANINVSYFESKPGWKLTHKRDEKGKIIAAVWTGSSIGPNEYMEFSFLGRNPADAATINWKIIQTYSDGTNSEWTPATTIKKATAQ